MDPLVHHLPTRSTFPFDELPTDIQSRILLHLPITTLVVCKAVSRSWRSLISSPAFAAAFAAAHTRHRDPIFLLFSGSAYLPSRDRWIPFPLPAARVLATAASLLLFADHRNQIAVFNPFSGLRSILPYLDPKRHQFTFIENTPSSYRILALRSTSTVRSFIYDSRRWKWEPSGEYAHGPVTLIDTVCMNGVIFCLIWSTNDLLVFDPEDGWWSRFSLGIRNWYIHGVRTLAFTRIVGYGGNLYLVAALKWEAWVMGIAMWVLDLEREEWRGFEFMPPELFSEFSRGTGGGLRSFEIVDRLGVICFCNCEGERILMFDLEERRWWWPRASDVGKTWIGCVVEPHIDLLK